MITTGFFRMIQHSGLAIAALLATAVAAPLQAVVFVVDSVLDEVDVAPGDGFCATAGATCTLRAAVQEASGLAGADAITLPAGTYTFTLAGLGDDGGDLDVTGSPLTITGAGAATTIIDAAGLGRVIETSFVSVSLTDLTIRNGDANVDNSCAGFFPDAGGGICGGAILNRVVVEDNTADRGGGIFGGVIATDTTIRTNSSDGIFSPGATVTLTRSTVSGNSGGGISAQNPTQFSNVPITIVNSTISGNIGTGLSVGGGCDGIFCSGIHTTVLNNVTIADNSGGGLFSGTLIFPGGDVFTYPLTISNTLITGNAGFDCDGHFNSAGYNVIDVADCILDGDPTGNRLGLDGLVEALAPNGGPTDTHALADASPAKNAR